MRVRARTIIASVVVALVGLAASADATTPQDPSPGSAAWAVRAVQNHLDAEGRGTDQLVHPDYAARLLPLVASYLAAGTTGVEETAAVSTDPYRMSWTRGRSRAISYDNRYGARIRGHLWAPARSRGRGPFPAVVIVNGYGGVEESLWWAAQGLAESGYVVLTFDIQGFGRSEALPDPQYCDPDGAWRQPQEMGLRETGDCAGQDNVPPEDVVAYVTSGVDWEALQAGYEGFAARFTLGALDAVEWLLSEANPWRTMVDGSRLGVAGHSAGAFAALLAGNGDPLERFDAAVVWDGYGAIPASLRVAPRVPTMFQGSEQENLEGPYLEGAPADPPPWVRNDAQFAAAGVDTARVILRGSTHQEWSYVPFPIANPLCSPFCNASRDGQVVAMHQTLAWFDRYVKGDAAAARRLSARRFDASADRVSIGVGAWDPIGQRNVPYTIAGERVANHLSFYLRSFSATSDYVCSDLRAGCR